MDKIIRVLHTEWSDGWGGQEIRIISEMIAVREKGIEVFLACRDQSLIKQKAQENNIEVFTLTFKGNADIKTLFNLIKIINDNGINIVNTHSGKDTWVGGLAAKLTRVKFIRTRHLSSPINSSKLNFINELADYIFTTGESVRSEMIKNNRINPIKIMSVPTGIDPDIYNPSKYNKNACRKLFNLKNDFFVIGIIAVLRNFKRHDRFLRMARNIIDINPEKYIYFVIAGDGPQKKNLTDMINILGLQNNVLMLGHISNVPELLTALDIFVLTSDNAEGVPQSVIQALFMQTAVVSTNAGSSIDLYHEKNFILVDKDSQNELNEVCNKLINNNNLSNQYAGNSRKYVLEKFSINKMTKKILKTYMDLTEK